MEPVELWELSFCIAKSRAASSTPYEEHTLEAGENGPTTGDVSMVIKAARKSKAFHLEEAQLLPLLQIHIKYTAKQPKAASHFGSNPRKNWGWRNFSVVNNPQEEGLLLMVTVSRLLVPQRHRGSPVHPLLLPDPAGSTEASERRSEGSRNQGCQFSRLCFHKLVRKMAM